MKKVMIVGLLSLVFLSFTVVVLQNNLPDKIRSDGWHLESQNSWDTSHFWFPISGTFYDQKVAKILRDSFLIQDPATPLKIYSAALKEEQVQYGYAWTGVAVGYGMIPGNGNFWDAISLSRYVNEAKRYVMSPLICDRASQSKLYEWAKPTLLAVWNSKPDTAQALDMFAVWKGAEYLNQYNYLAELVREKKTSIDTSYDYSKDGKKIVQKVERFNTFTHYDWKNRSDEDAKLYAFWHRRIKEYQKTAKGFSLTDAKHWNQIAFDNMLKNAKPLAMKLFVSWKAMWENKQITNVPGCMLVPSSCD